MMYRQNALALSLGLCLLLTLAMPVQAQTADLEVKLIEKTYMHDPELDWVWGVQIIAEVTNSSAKPVSGAVVRCSLLDAKGQEIVWEEQKVGVVQPLSGQRVLLEIRRKDSPPSGGVPGLGSSKASRADKGLAAFKALQPLLTLK